MDVPEVRPEPAGAVDLADDAPIDVDRALANIARQLQEQPQRYRLFGLWWWAVKPMLARVFTRDALPILGGYNDPEQAAMIAAHEGSTSEAAVLRQALYEYGHNARFARPEGRVEWGSELFTIYDPDVEA